MTCSIQTMPHIYPSMEFQIVISLMKNRFVVQSALFTVQFFPFLFFFGKNKVVSRILHNVKSFHGNECSKFVVGYSFFSI